MFESVSNKTEAEGLFKRMMPGWVQMGIKKKHLRRGFLRLPTMGNCEGILKKQVVSVAPPNLI